MLVKRLCWAWARDPASLIPYTESLVPRLLLYREAQVPVHSASNYENSSVSVTAASVPARVMVLHLLETCLRDESPAAAPVQSSLGDLVLRLLRLNTSHEFSKTLLQGTEKWGQKLRLWQVMLTHHMQSYH